VILKLLAAPLFVLLCCVLLAFGQSEARPSGTTDTAEPTLSARNEADCTTFDGNGRKNGVVWCGPGTDLPFQVLAERSAPILWFSPAESLLEKTYKIPQPLPCDAAQKASVVPCKDGEFCGDPADNKPAMVYYQIRRIVQKKGSTAATFVEKDLKLDEIEKLTLKYYFYYCVDCGFGGHRHDLENIELEILIEKESGGPI